MFSKLIALLGTVSLAAGASAAAAQSAAPLSLAHSAAARAGAGLSESSEIRGDAKWILGAIALALIIWGAIELLDNDDEAFPVSP